jgi:hypothetical protein
MVDCLWTDISGFHLALSCHLIVISLSFILMSFTALFMLFVLVVFENKLRLICLTFTGTLNQTNSISLCYSRSPHFIPFRFQFFISLLLWSMLACLYENLTHLCLRNCRELGWLGSIKAKLAGITRTKSLINTRQTLKSYSLSHYSVTQPSVCEEGESSSITSSVILVRSISLMYWPI